MARILVGTASWTDKTLIASGRFYPAKDNTPEGRLRYYASQFPLVEVDSSYYAIPDARGAAMGGTHAPIVPVQRQGVSTSNGPSDSAGCTAERYRASAGAYQDQEPVL